MFRSIYKYNLKMLFKDKTTVFWLMLYPIILSTIFYFAFSNIGTYEKLEKINISICEEKSDDSLNKTLDNTGLFNIKNINKDESIDKLKDGEIDCVVNVKDNNNIELIVVKEGFEESLTKVVIDSFVQVKDAINSMVKNGNYNPEALNFSMSDNYINENTNTSKANNAVIIYFYSVLAMTGLMCATLGINIVVNIQANQSDVAQRLAISPTHKMKALISAMASSFTFQMLIVALTLIYYKYVLNISFGGDMFLAFIATAIGSIFGLSFGVFLGALTKKKQGIKIALAIALTMLSCFLSGMMFLDMKYLLQINFPIIAKINPATLVTDSLYSLYFYDNLGRFTTNSITLLVESAILCFVAYLILRRQKYDSI